MDSTTARSLSKAYELIEAERLEDARVVLEPILAQERNNADAWWLYAHAVTDSKEAQTALRNILQIKPDYPGASQLLQKLTRKIGETDSQHLLTQEKATSDLTDADIDTLLAEITDADDVIGNSDFDEEDLLDDFTEFDDESHTHEFAVDDLDIDQDDKGETEPAPRRIRFSQLMLGLITLLILVIIIGLLVRKQDTDSEEPTTVAAQSVPTDTATSLSSVDVTAEVTIEPTSTPTSPPSVTTTEEVTSEVTEAVPADPLEIVISNIPEVFSDYDLSPDSPQIAATDLGSTLIVEICVQDATTARTILNDAMSIIAGEITDSSGLIDAVGISLTDCQQDAIMNIIASPLTSAIAFANGELTEEEFLKTWRAVG